MLTCALTLSVLLAQTPVAAGPGAVVAQRAAPPVSPEHRDLARGLAALEEEDLDGARTALEAALGGGPYALDEVQQLYRGLGIIRAYFGDQEGARWAFARLLAIAPQAMLAYTTSPKATFLFQEEKEAARSRPALRLELELPSVAPLDAPIDIRCRRASDPLDAVRRIEVLHRLKGEQTFQRLEASVPGAGDASGVQLPPVPEARATADDEGTLQAIVEVALVAYDERGWEIFQGPAPESPQEIPVGFDAPGPWYTRWWLWGLVGGAMAAAGATAVVLALQPESPDVPFTYRVDLR